MPEKQFGPFEIHYYRGQCFNLGLVFHCGWHSWDLYINLPYIIIYFIYYKKSIRDKR